MRKISASEKSDLALIAALYFLLILYLAYNTYVEKGVAEPQNITETVVEGESLGIMQH
ncbi:hypothetical protein [Pontibacter diazotrophicus]|uniref:hypothetical protein n=1 Tax=Pontibacter diazotrophicus TaxID=1400979 RepID=UPI0015F1B878|nr:hypothetical protein [Pontibacter diazotrophicus]